MDRARIEAFLDRFIGYASGTTTIGLLAIADRCGLLTWLGEHGSGSAHMVAQSAGLEERYVLEILSGLAAAGVLDYDPAAETFELPAEHALFVSDASSPYFMGGWLDMLPSVMGHIDALADAATHGGGVAFGDFGAELITGISRGNAPSQRVFLTSRWLPAISGLIDRLEAGIRVADVGCGTGTAAILMAESYPNSHVCGYDVSTGSLEVARSEAGSLTNVEFAEHSVDEIPVEPPFQLVTSFDVIHDLADPLAGMRRIRESLAPDGQFLMMEPNLSSHLEENLHDRGALMYGISAMHCMTQSLADEGAGLGAAWGREAAESLAGEAGFSSFQLLDDITNRFSAFYLLGP